MESNRLRFVAVAGASGSVHSNREKPDARHGPRRRFDATVGTKNLATEMAEIQECLRSGQSSLVSDLDCSKPRHHVENETQLTCEAKPVDLCSLS